MGARLALLLVVAVAALPALQASAATPSATRWVVSSGGYSITLPSDWYAIPRTKAAIQQAVSTYTREKQSSLASAYRSILASPQSMAELTKYDFQAFLWPPLQTVVPTEISVQVVSGGHFTSADLPAAAQEYRTALAGPGASIAQPSKLTLPAGPAEKLTGSVSNGGGVHTGLALYFLAHAGHIYVLSFEVDATFLHAKQVETVFGEIAQHFSFSTTS